jgi:hypothetical protein
LALHSAHQAVVTPLREKSLLTIVTCPVEQGVALEVSRSGLEQATLSMLAPIRSRAQQRCVKVDLSRAGAGTSFLAQDSGHADLRIAHAMHASWLAMTQ